MFEIIKKYTEGIKNKNKRKLYKIKITKCVKMQPQNKFENKMCANANSRKSPMGY